MGRRVLPLFLVDLEISAEERIRQFGTRKLPGGFNLETDSPSDLGKRLDLVGVDLQDVLETHPGERRVLPDLLFVKLNPVPRLLDDAGIFQTLQEGSEFRVTIFRKKRVNHERVLQ